jgi:hypothetical protein
VEGDAAPKPYGERRISAIGGLVTYDTREVARNLCIESGKTFSTLYDLTVSTEGEGRGKANVMAGDAIGNHGLRERYEMGAAGVVAGGSQD